MYKERIADLKQRIRDLKIDCIFATDPENIKKIQEGIEELQSALDVYD